MLVRSSLARRVQWITAGDANMQLFVDQLKADGDYRGAHGTSWVHPSMPTAVLTGGFLDDRASGGCWLYHVEGGCFITAETLADTAVVEMDTLVMVARSDLGLADPAFIDRMWQRAGGPPRRVAHAGMPRSGRAALAAYAQ